MKALARLAALLLLLIPSGRSAAQPQVPVQVNLDHAVFAYDQGTSLLELYFGFDAASLHFEPLEQGFATALPLDLVLRRSTQAELAGTPSDPVWRDSLLLRFAVTDTSVLQHGQQFVHQVRTTVPPGEYELSLLIPEDPAIGRPVLELRRDVLVPDFAAAGRVGLSDVVLASSVQPSQDQDMPFYKNGLAIHPNANQLYGRGLTRLYYYAETYHPERIAGADGAYTVYAYVSEANRPQPVGELQRRLEREARTPDVLVGSFDLSGLPSGSYFLRLALLNDKNEAMAEQSRKFFVYNPDVQQPVVAYETSFETSPYAAMPREEVDREMEHIALVSNSRERRRMRSIQDLDERRRFLMEFWQHRDPVPGTPVNEFKDEFMQRVQYANDRYATNQDEGWETDRGRVVVRYGLPSSIEPHLYDRELAPHEIWVYNNIPGEGQAIFVFADRTGFGRFELIHSDVSGERSLPHWQQELRRN